MTDTTSAATALLPHLGRLDQVGVVVDDLDRAERGMRELFGLEPRVRAENEYRGVEFRGATVDAVCGVLMYDLGGIEIEFLCPVTDRNDGSPNIWQERLDTAGPGLHHVRFDIADDAAVAGAMSALGVATIQAGESMRGGGVRYRYFETAPLIGFDIETLNAAEHA